MSERRSRPRLPEAWLRDMVAWGAKLARHVEGMTLDEFRADERTQDAVSKCVEVIGEAARGLLLASPGIGDRHPDLRLAEAYAARNRLTHGYFGTDVTLLWNAATRSVPGTVAAAARLLAAPDPP